MNRRLTEALALVARLALTLTMAALPMLACSPAPDSRTSQRFLYVVSCDARVDKLDTVNDKKVETFHLSERSGSPPAVPAPADGKMDGCLAQRLQVDGAGKHASLIAPKQARLDSAGLQEFQALTFSLPDWKLVATQAAGKLPQAPWLQLQTGSELKVLDDAQWSPQTQLDLRHYQGQDDAVTGIIVASSGSTSLLSLLYAKSDQLALGLADPRARTLTRLTDLPTTSLRHVHLAPGGGFVLVELTEPNVSPAKRTGALRLYDSNGKQAAQWMDERLRGMSFVALTPNGKAVYRNGTEYHFVSMGRPFGSAAVTQPMPELAAPGLVLTAQ
jgi:hypothetical protein